MTRIQAGAALALLLSLGACCKPGPVGGVLVVNNTDAPVTFDVLGDNEYGPWTAPVGEDNMAVAKAGPGQIELQLEGGATRLLNVDFDVDRIAIIAARPGSCIALADHTRQYGGDGVVEVLAVATDEIPGTVEYLGGTYLGPNSPLPKDKLETDTVARFTNVPCELIDDETRLAKHLYALD